MYTQGGGRIPVRKQWVVTGTVIETLFSSIWMRGRARDEEVLNDAK